MFHHNIERIIVQNKEEGCWLEKPPEHIEKQTVNVAAAGEEEVAKDAQSKKPKSPPNYLVKSTLSTLKKQSKRNLQKYVTQMEDN